MTRLHPWVLALSLASLTGTAACGDNNNLPDALIANVVDTVTIGALVGTPISVPSGYAVAGGPIRTDTTSSFDFAYNIEPSGRHVFLPLAVLGLSTEARVDPGLRSTTLAFDAIAEAPSDGYVTRDTVPFSVGDRFIIRGRVVCAFLGVPQYGKVEVLAVDEQARVATLQTLTNTNCGYKGLEPGIPEE